jgi:hypothetical protein
LRASLDELKLSVRINHNCRFKDKPMLTPPQIQTYLKAQPFRPFRLHMASGKSFDIRHLEMVKIGRSFLLVFSFEAGELELVENGKAFR